MSHRTRALLAVACVMALTACDAAKKVDKALDKLDNDEAKGHLTSAKALVAAGKDAPEDCSWANSQTGDAASKPSTAELRTLCSVDVPLMHATRALTKAEAAKAEQPEAPSFTECSSDDWAQAKAKVGSDPRFAELAARWAKVCPGS